MDGLAGYIILVVSDVNHKICLFGSPAQKERDDLKIKDKIVEVNGKDISNFTYVDILKYIRNCIDSKKVSLKVKRNKRSGVIACNNIPPGKRAIALAIESEATLRLLRLTKLKLVKAVHIGNIPESVADVIRGPIYITDFPNVNEFQDHTDGIDKASARTLTEVKSTSQSEFSSTSDILTSTKDSSKTTRNMASAVMHRGGHANHYGNGQINMDESHTEMAVDCPPSYVAAHPPNGGVNTPRLETPPPTPLDSELMQSQKENVEKDLHAAAIAASSLPQPEMDLTRIHRMRESMRRKKELEKRDRKVRQDMTKEDNAEKLRKMKTMTPEEEAAANKKGVFNLGYEDDDTSEAESSIQEPSTLNIEGVFAALREISRETNDPSISADLKFIQSMMHNDTFQESVDLHNTISKKTVEAKTSCLPVQLNVSPLIDEADDDLTSSKDSTARELAGILSKHHMRGVIKAHDGVAQFANIPPPHPSATQPVDAEDNLLLQNAAKYTTKPAKIVRVNKTNIPLGATVRVEEEEGNVIISRLVVGGAAEKSNALHEGDEILEVNGQPMRGKDVNEVGDAISGMTGLLKFLIIPAEGQLNGKPNALNIDMTKEPVMHVRALFDYDAYDDMYLPCRELGLSFQKGDILHVMSHDDQDWWQAYREGDQDHLTLPGLIPGQNFQHQLEVIRLNIEKKDEQPEVKKGFMCGRGKRRKKKTKTKRKENMLDSVSESGDEIEVYEEMALYHQPESKKRPIVLIGPANVGRHELRQRLMENDRDRFSFAIPHTTRPRKDNEVDGQDYHFISMKDFETMISDNEFLEHGSFQKDLYGTTIGAVRKVIDSGKICVINLHAESLKLLKKTSLMPYIIFIAPPTLERLRQNVSKEGKQIKEDELRNIIENARVIETKYAHYFDETIRNTDLSRSYAELLRHINKLDTEPQWVPAAWLD
uniref:MAGUK p55 subfamily member 5-like isoform X1 n=2 Tax=Styela clava TaxID=7725 RepID=UPI00193A39B8|nr:MAGUK p55 subfamily member 5-like isoform X1 [Styela clava]